MEIPEALEDDVQDAPVVQKNVPACSQKKVIAAPEDRRVKLVLAPRTKPMEPSVIVSNNSVFGGAKPVDTAAREKEIEDRLERENGTIPKYPKVKREVRKFTSSVIANNIRLSSYLYKNDHRLVPCYQSPILRECNPEPEQVCKLFIGGLNHETTEETLKGHFEKWGEITQCVVIQRNPRSKNSRGFAFVTYKMATMVHDAIAAGPQQIDGHEVVPKQALSKEHHELRQRSNTSHETRTRAEPTGNSHNVGYRKAKKNQLANEKLGSRSNHPSTNSKDPEWEKTMYSRLLKLVKDYKLQFTSLENEKKDFSEREKSLSEKEKSLWEKIADEMKIVFPLDCSGSTCIKKFTRLKTIYEIMIRDKTEIQDINLFNELQNVFGSNSSSVSSITVTDVPELITSCDNATNTVSKTESESLEMTSMLSSENSLNLACLNIPKNMMEKPRLLKKWKRPMKSLLLKTYSHYKPQFIMLENEKKYVSEEGEAILGKEIALWEKIAVEMKKVFPLEISGLACIKKFTELKTVYEMMKLNDTGNCDINYFNDLENVFGI